MANPPEFPNANKKELDRLFLAADGDQTAQTELKARNDYSSGSGSIELANFHKALSAEHSNLVEEQYDRFAEAVAKDPRLTKFLPNLAIELMTDSFNTTYPTFGGGASLAKSIDKNGDGISKAE